MVKAFTSLAKELLQARENNKFKKGEGMALKDSQSKVQDEKKKCCKT